MPRGSFSESCCGVRTLVVVLLFLHRRFRCSIVSVHRVCKGWYAPLSDVVLALCQELVSVENFVLRVACRVSTTECRARFLDSCYFLSLRVGDLLSCFSIGMRG